MWQLRYNAIDPATGKKKESAIIVGVLVDFPTESACWREVDRQRLTDKINQPEIQSRLRFRQIADFYLNHKVFGELAHTTQYLHRHIINDYLVARWADKFALELRGLVIEEWLNSLHKNEGGELEGPTLGKIKQYLDFLRLRGCNSDARADHDHSVLHASAGAYSHAPDCRYRIALVGNRRTSVAGH